MIPKFRAWIKSRKRLEQVQHLMWHKRVITSNEYVIYTNLPENVVLMQSTGLIDKNGVEIFEGDVVRFSYTDDDFTWTDKVDWNSKSLSWRVSETGDLLGYVLETDDTLIEVIGNIHEHPGLLETTK